MPLTGFFQALSPWARVATAVAPFAIAVALRLGFGRNRATEILLTVTTSWFVVNVLIAPYSIPMTQGLHQMLRR
jgi:hypothetical protein